MHRWAKRQLKQLAELLDGADDLRRASVDSVQQARMARSKEAVAARLAGVTVDELASRGSKIQLQALRNAGIGTAADVLRLGQAGLLQISGIGESSTTQLIQLASNIAQIQPGDLRPSADPSNWLPSDIDLVRALRLFATVGTLLSVPHLEALRQFVGLLSTVARATRWLNWLFSGRAKRKAVRADYATATAGFSNSQIANKIDQLQRGISDAARLAQVSQPDAEVVSDWRTSSADLMAALEDIVAQHGTAEDRAEIREKAVATTLSDDMVRRIEDTRLDCHLLDRKLRAYQEFGAKFALVVGRGLLGDDMGLGKTTQALAAIAHATSSEGRRHHVVVCPASVFDTWNKEMKVVCPTIDGYAFRQPGREAAYERWCHGGGVLLTSYNQVKDLLDHELPEIGFMVADEAHLVKNPEAQRTKNTTALAHRAHRAILMSGTPLENRAEEMISLASLADPAQGKRLRMQFDDGRAAHLNPERFRRALGDFYLRRNQGEVLGQLPECIASDESIRVGSLERKAYVEAITSNNLMAARSVLSVAGGVHSVKMERLKEIVDESRANDSKLLVFSYFISVVESAAAVVGQGCAQLTGSVSLGERQRRIDAFDNAEGFAALAMQIDVGGVGLNLQSASVVVLMEPQYKPSTEWQAVKRAHRMGQTRRVVVYRLIAEDSIDERLVELGWLKAELFDRLASQSDLADSSLSARDPRIDENLLLAQERERLGLSPRSAA
ncbi:MAG: DEAD/DEAH box helicase [Pseudonocardiaceae bacterium]